MYSQAIAAAREAFERGDHVLQLSLSLTQQTGRVGPSGGYTAADRTNVNSDLNGVCNEGWSIVSASVVFVPTSQVSRDKFLTSGQQLAVSGEVVGYYVFSRDETKRSNATRERQQVDHRTTSTSTAIPVRRRRSASEIEPLSPLAD